MRQQNINNENCLFGLRVTSIYIPVLSVCLLISMVGCNKSPDTENKAVTMNSENMLVSEKTRNALEVTKNKSIIFLHHSVGGNILNGLRGLAKESGVDLKIQTVRNASISNDKQIIDITGGVNGKPKTKIDSFADQINNLKSNMIPDVAFMKFCFVSNKRL